jgi:hypothetical protein
MGNRRRWLLGLEPILEGGWLHKGRRARTWDVESEPTALALLGDVTIDLAQAKSAPAEIVINAYAILRGVEVFAPKGTLVELTGRANNDHLNNQVTWDPHEDPERVVRVHGHTLLGDVTARGDHRPMTTGLRGRATCPYELCQGAAEDVGEILGVGGETAMASGEVDERRAEAFGKRGSRALRELALGGGPPSDHDPDRRALQRGQVRLVERDGQQAVAKEPLVRRHRLGRRRLRRGVLTLEAHVDARKGGEPLPRGAVAAVAVGVVDVVHTGACLLGFGQEQSERSLVGDEGSHVAGVVDDQGESGDGATAAAEHVCRLVADGLEHPAYVVGQQVRLGILVRVVDRAAVEASGIESHDGVVLSEQRRHRGKSRSAHRVPYQHERRASALYLVVQARSWNMQRVTRWRRHSYASPRSGSGRGNVTTEATP